jgi:hypothetical protein
MSGWIAGALGLALLISGVRAETLTVATDNIENYGTSHRMTEVGYRKDYPKPEPEKRALRAVFQAMNADLVVPQEMGPRPYLDELQRDLKNEGLDYPHVALATAADADRPIAIMSRRALLKVTTHADLEFTYFGAKEPVKRGWLEATVVPRRAS